jgi:hypothetical protein
MALIANINNAELGSSVRAKLNTAFPFIGLFNIASIGLSDNRDPFFTVATTGTAEEVLGRFSFDNPLGIATNGTGLYIRAGGNLAANANNKQFKIVWDNTGVDTFFNYTTNTNGGDWMIESWIFRTGTAGQSAITKYIDTDDNIVQVATGTRTFASGTTLVDLRVTTPTSLGDADRTIYAVSKI